MFWEKKNLVKFQPSQFSPIKISASPLSDGHVLNCVHIHQKPYLVWLYVAWTWGIADERLRVETLGGGLDGIIHSATRLFPLWSYRDFFCYWYQLDRICVRHIKPLNPDQPLILIKLLGDTLQRLVTYNQCTCRLPFSLEPLDKTVAFFICCPLRVKSFLVCLLKDPEPPLSSQ